MLSVLVLLASRRPANPVSLPASQSVWVYVHAGNPAGDEFLRVWGVGGLATPEGKGEGDDWSYGYLNWDVSSLPNRPLTSATLNLCNVNPAGFGDADTAKAAPLEARGLVGSFSGASWDYSLAVTIHPDLAKSVFGLGIPKPWGDSKEPIPISIDLMKGPGDFNAYLAAARAGSAHTLNLALTSAIDPSTAEGGGGKGGVYKIYSAVAKTSSLKPTLTLGY